MRAANALSGMAFTLRQLQYFIAVAEEGTVSGAAQSLSISQSAVTDAIKESTPQAVRRLHEDGVAIVMATGDAKAPAESVAVQLGIDAFHAGVKPDDKLGIVSDLQQQGRRVAMAGDGINDAPALAQADIGIAMGTGSDIAIDAAQVTLVKGDLRALTAAASAKRWPAFPCLACADRPRDSPSPWADRCATRDTVQDPRATTRSRHG